jgi:hypothetical protein
MFGVHARRLLAFACGFHVEITFLLIPIIDTHIMEILPNELTTMAGQGL